MTGSRPPHPLEAKAARCLECPSCHTHARDQFHYVRLAYILMCLLRVPQVHDELVQTWKLGQAADPQVKGPAVDGTSHVFGARSQLLDGT